MSAFLLAFNFLLEIEGGYSAKDDNGRGAVNMGITQTTLDDVRRRVNPSYVHLPHSVQQLTREKVIFVYLTEFWHPSRAGCIRDQRLTNAYFTTFVQAWREATKLLQRSVGVRPDGVFGPKTAAAVNGADPALVLESFKRHVRRLYEHRARENPRAHADDLPGWYDRLGKL